jgi:hypothetical protein
MNCNFSMTIHPPPQVEETAQGKVSRKEKKKLKEEEELEEGTMKAGPRVIPMHGGPMSLYKK